MKKYYVISSRELGTLKEVEELTHNWFVNGKLDKNCKVYEIYVKNKVFEPTIKLEELEE